MAKRKALPPLSEAQLEIMNVVWDREEASVGEVREELCRRREVARNTVQTMMVRLEQKGWLKHRRQGTAFLYRATVPRASIQKSLVQRLLQTAFDGSTEGLLMAVLDQQRLSPEEARRIRELIDQATRRKS